MIQERYCSYELSKLLKDKGFDEPCRSIFVDCGDYIDFYYSELEEVTNLHLGIFEVLRPTHQMACDWLREKHGILISIIPQEVAVGVNALCYGIYSITEKSYYPIHNGQPANFINDYNDAVEAALEYCLTELI